MHKTNLSTPDMENAPPRLLSIRQAAHDLGVCRTIVYELIRDGKIDSVKIGRRRLIPRDAVGAFVAALSDKGGD
jgi:excisionase family DNA binding protein